jgi:hypothetical protein
MVTKYNREDFDVLIPASKGDKKPDSSPMPPKDGSRSVNINEDEVESIKDWSEIEQELKDAGLTGEQKPNNGGGEEKRERADGKGEGQNTEEGGEEKKDEGNGKSVEEGGEEKKDEGNGKSIGDGGYADETKEERASRIKREAIKNHNRIVTNLNNVKTFFKKNEKIMSDGVKKSFEDKISELESIAKESEQELKKN